MADKKKKINSAISAAGRAASKTSSNVADQLKKKRKSAQQAAQMQESQKKLPSWYGSIDTSKPRVQQRSATSTPKGRSVFTPQQQTTTQTASPAGGMWPIVPKKSSAGLPSLAQVGGAPYRSDLAAYLPSSAMRGTVDPAKVTGAHYAEWMSDMADQKAADEARAKQEGRQQQKKQALQDKREQYSGIGWEDNSDGSPGIKSIIHGYQNDLRDERDPKKRSEIQGQIDWLSSYAASQYPEAGQYFAEEDARQEASLKRRQEGIQRRQTEAERNLENARHGIYTDDVLREYGKYDETLAGFDRDIAAATDPDVIGYLTRAREAYMANPANYQDLELSDEQQAEVMARYIRQSDYAKLASEQAAEDSPDYYKKLDRQYGFSATEEAFAKGLASPAETDFNGYVKQRQGGLSVSDMVSPFYRTQDYYRQYYTLDEYAIWQQYLRGGNQEAADAYEDYIRDRVGRRASQDWQEGVEKMTSGRLTPETFRGYKERTYTVPNLGGEGTVSYTRRYSVQPTAAQKVIGGAVGTVAEGGANFMSGLHSLDVLGQSLERAVTGSDKPIDYYRSSATTETAQTTWGTVASELNQYGDLNDFVSRIYGQRVNIPVVGDKGLGELYGAGVNGLNNWMNRMAFGGSKWLGVAADLQAASGKFNSAHETGASDLQSVFYGSAVGAAEGLGEQMGYDKFLEWGEEKGLFNSTSGKILLGLVLQPGNEFVEESVTEIMDQAASLGILDDKSEYAGMPYSERLEQVIYAGIQGAIGSYVSTGGQYAEMSVENNAQRRATQELTGQLVLANDNGAQLAQAYTDATGKPGDTPTKVRQAGRMLEEAATLGKERYESTYAQETGDAAVQYYQDNQPKGQEADKQASETVYAAIRKVLADKKLTRREQAAMDSIPGVREAVAAYRKGGAMEGTVNREGSTKIKRGMENALLSVDHNLQSAGLDSNVETDIKTSERMQQTAQGVQEAAQERKAMMQMREGENAQSQVDGQDVELLGMTGVGDKATLNVRNQDGQVQEVSLNDVTYGSDRKATAYAIGADMENTALANSFVATLTDNQVPARVAAGMQAAYDYAYGGAPSVESLKGSILTEGLNDVQLNRAFELGQQARQSAVQVAQEAKMKQALKQANVEWKGGTVDTSKVDMANLNAEQQRQVNLVQLVAGVTGINVELFQSKADANGRYRGENGSYNATTNTIRLDVNAGAYNAGQLSQVTLLRTMSHELTHALQQNSPAQYEALKHAVLDTLTSKSGASIEEMAARKMEQDSSLKKADVALDEVVAEACENMLRDSDAMEQLIAQHPAEAKTFLEKMKQFFTDIVNAIRAAFGGSGTSMSREATALMQQAEEYLDICEKWSKALQDTAEVSGRSVFYDDGAQPGDTQHSMRVTDEDTLEFLNNQDTVTTYKTMQLVDGKLYPPMAAVVAGNYEDASVLGQWEQAVEHPELVKNGKFTLNKGKGQGTIAAAYNPYMHSSNLVLNDQFSGAYTRPNLVTVECQVPVSELTSGYRAQYAKDSVGWHAWHTGTVAGALRKATGTERQVLLSRYIKPVRIVSNAETAGMYKALLDGTGISVPDNVVSPGLLEELRKVGVPIKKSGRIKDGDVSERFDKGNEDIRYSLRDYSYEELTAKPDMIITSIDTSRNIDRDEAIRLGRENVLKYSDRFNPNGTPMMYVNDLGKYVIVGKKGLEHGLDRRVAQQSSVIANIGDILNNSIVVNEAHPKREGVKNTWILLGMATDSNGMPVYVRSVVNQSTNELEEVNSLYSVYGKKNEAGRSVAAYASGKSIGAPSSSTVTIAELLNGVKEKFSDVLSDDVVRELGIKRVESEFTPRLKYSLRENDRKYMDAVEQGNTAEAQKLVDAAAKAAGYKNLFYHGAKKGGGFTTFRGWSYFTENKGYAQRYSEAGNANSLYTTYVKMERPFDTRIPEVRELFDEARMEYGMGQLQDTGLPDWTDGYDLSEYIEENDLPYDGIVLDEGGDFVNGKPVSRGLSYVIRDSAQIKSADAVTYDDNGKVIPLSERFNSENDDIRYQMRDEDGGTQGLVGMFDETPRLGEAHIDQRTWENMSDRRVHSFMNDYPASRMWLARMASVLQSDVSASTAGQRFMNEEGTFMGQKRDTTPLLAEMKDSGYTWQQMSDVFGKMAEVFENGDLEGKVPETALWKRAELILDRAVTEGYTDMNGIEYRPDAGYMRYKDALPGAKAREIPANAVEDTFEDVDNRIAGGENAAVQTGGDGERVQLQGDTAYQEKQRNAKSGIALMDGGPSNRELLSSALESAAQTPEELRYVQSYKKQAQKIAEMEGKLAERRAEVQQLQGMKNRTADQEIRMKNLQQSIAETESMIDKRDKGLLKMEAMEPLRNVLDRERANYRETLKQAKKDAAARQREKDAAKLDDALLATQMHEGREWAAKLHEAENRVAEANQKVEDLKAQSLADRMHESSEWAAKLRKAENQLATAKRQLETAKMQRIAERMAEGRKWAEKVRRAKEQADRRAARLREQADRRVEKIQDKADRRTLQGKIIRRVKALDTMLRTPSNTRHVPDALRGATANILQYFTDEGRIFKAEDMQAAANAYAALNTEENSNMAEGMYDPDTYDRMVALMEVTKKGQSLKNLSMDELMMVDKVLQNLSHIIQNANAVFVNGRRRNLEELVNEEQQTLQEKGRYGSFKLKDNAFVDMLRRGNITAPYFFKHLGGPLGELGTAILNGETAYGIEVGRATERFQAIEEKYHRDAWKDKRGDTLTLKNGDGDKIQLTREQAMGVWATWKREHSIADRETHHLDQGGILLQQEKKIFKKTYAQDSAFRIGTAEMVDIDNWLTQDQKNYVDEVVSYLSNDMAELGNITSNALHGYSKFGEGYYYPFRTSDEFRPTKIGKDENAMPLKLMGFTKSVRSKSNAPVIVTDFTSTAADHINSMLTYYAFAEAQDNFMRLYNFRMDHNHSIKRSLSGAYGANPGKFIRAFMNDMYGGVGMSMNERDANRFLGAFKKGAVMASLSVAIQQPSAIMRAMALIDPKYFVGSPLKGGFAEAQKYAGTAVIKDMGSFDTSTGRSAVQYITGDGAKTAYGKFSEKVGDIGGWLPEKMDAITWGRMWSAVKRETAARTGLNVNSEELKVQAGKRFDEVMRLTQVYDSTLAKSELMREKNLWAKMVTAFMAEPTVTYNMLMDAVIDAKGKRFGAATKSVGAVIAATLLNSLLASVIYAARDDDDEDATYFERYVKNLVGSLDPIDVTLNLVPMVKDVYEIFRGYDVERTDMSVFNDIYTYSKVLSNPDKSWLDRLKSGVSLAGIITGIPAKNLLRDIEGAVNTFKTVKDTEYRDGAAKMAALQGLSEWAFGPDVSKAATIDKLVQAMAKGDQAETAAQMNTLSTFYEGDEKKRKTAIKKAGKEAYIDGGLTDAQALRVLEGIGITGDEADKVLLDWQYGKKTGGKTVSGAGSDYLEGEIDRETALDALGRTGAEEEDVETRMRKLDYQKESGISYSGLQDAYTDGRISRAEALRVRTEVGGQKPEEAEKTLLQWDYEKDTGRKWADMGYDYLSGSLTKVQAMSAMQKYGGKTEAEAYWTVDEWEYREVNPDADGYSKFHRVTELASRGQSISKAVQEIYTHSDYKTAKDCGSAVTSALTSYWKPLYIAATPAQREQMEPIMLAAYRAAYETLGEKYYGDKRRLKAIRKWLED